MTMLSKSARALTFGLALVLAACAGKEVIDLNTDLTRLAEQRKQYDTLSRTKAGKDRDAALAQFVQADSELERLTDAAYKAAQEASDVKAKISYYRIAATAGWQRGDVRTVQISQEGTGVCNHSDGFAVSPRDCVMLLVIPDLAVNDAWGRKLASIKQDAAQPDLVSKYSAVVYDLLDSYDGLTQAEARAGASRAPEQLAGVIRSRRATIAANINELVTFLAISGSGPDHPTRVKALCDSIRTRVASIVPAECKNY